LVQGAAIVRQVVEYRRRIATIRVRRTGTNDEEEFMSLIGAVLLPHDGSPPADATLPYAAELVRITGASLEVVRVLETQRPVDDDVRKTVDWIDPAHTKTETPTNDRLDPVVQSLAVRGVTAKAVVRVGDPRQEILAEAATLDRPLILLASHGRSGLSRLVFGSVATRVLQAADVPVMIVRSNESEHPTESVTFKRIMVPLDGSKRAEQALPYAAVLAQGSAGELHLVRVAETYRDELPEDPKHFFTTPSYEAMLDHFEQLEHEAQRYLATAAQRLEGESLAVTSEVLSGDPLREIASCAERELPDLIVMTTHGRSGISRWFYGSVADRVLATSTTPVLLIRSSE
jgi:nucleotide-binding universal stress UspA family protein